MKSLPLADVRILSPFVAFLEDHGAPVNRLLDENNLSREFVNRGLGKVSKMQLYGFLEESSQRSGLPDLGFRLGQLHGMHFLGSVGRSVLRAATLKDATQTFAAHLGASMAGHRIWLEPDGKENVWLLKSSCDGFENHHAASNQCGLMTLIALVREAVGPDWQPDKVRIGMDPCESVRGFEALDRAEIEFNRNDLTGVRFPLRFLSLPVNRPAEGPVNDPMLDEQPESFSEALEATLRSQLPFLGVPTVNQAAEIAGTSVRSLQRRLDEDGLTYRRVIDRTRFRIASDRLQEDSKLTTRQLAADLFYSSPSSFVRSFRRIAGVTPGDFARETRQADDHQ